MAPPPAPADRLAGLAPAAVATARAVMQALEAGASARAEALLRALPPAARRHGEILRLAGLAALAQGRAEAATALLAAAARERPDDALTRVQLGIAHAQRGDLGAAEACFLTATELDPGAADSWHNLARARLQRGDAAAALAACARLLEVAPTHEAGLVLRADLLRDAGDLGGAERALRAALAQHPDSIPAWAAAANLDGFRPTPADLARLERLARAGVPAAQRIPFAFAHARLLERAGRYPEAWRGFVAANALQRRTIRWDAAAVSALVDRILAADAAAPAPAPAPNDAGAEWIFLVGMPRSGSTLAEQVLSSHPQVQGSGEHETLRTVLLGESRRRDQPFPDWMPAATAADWARLGAEYRARCRGWRDARPRCTDKTLTNWQMLGALRRMLPAARVIHCRRDPLETLWSCWTHRFDAAQLFTHELGELVAFARDCSRAMHVWSERWPGAITPLQLEDLLREPEAQIRRLLAACALPWDAACLHPERNLRLVRTASASQVRQPLRRRPTAAARYGALLDPLRAALAAPARTAAGPGVTKKT